MVIPGSMHLAYYLMSEFFCLFRAGYVFVLDILIDEMIIIIVGVKNY